MTPAEAVESAIKNGGLPSPVKTWLEAFKDDGRRYTSQEGLHWDFKDRWPFSYSDSYFAGIARLICAFANTVGGAIIFGVHDTRRTAGHNKVTPNVDRLQQSLRSLLSNEVRIQTVSFGEGTDEAVVILLVFPISVNQLPVRFTRKIEGYKEGIIWIRNGNEVRAAEPKNIPSLYCRSAGEIEDDEVFIDGILPPSPGTVKRFIGRMETIDKLFCWLKKSDEPRHFLYGRGGSGKTTIAYQIAKIIKSSGSSIKVNAVDKIDNVIFVTSKARKLNPLTLDVEEFMGLDFENERELYISILTIGNWTNEDCSKMSLNDLNMELKEFFDTTSNFIVIDDIDTLTTKGLEAGFDNLYKILVRAKRSSKILYTLRNAPSHSLTNATEVPGLDMEGEFGDFVNACSEQFHVQPPERPYYDKIATISERRPLVVESIIALRRSTGNYEQAIQLFEQSSGDDVRNYVFVREWNALPANNYGRYLLAIMSIYARPLTFDDLVTLSQYDESRVREAIESIREMFVTLNQAGSETTYSLGTLTQSFLSKEIKNLDIIERIKARVRQYKINFYPENPDLSRIKDRVEFLIDRHIRYNSAQYAKDAFNTVMDPNLMPKITEDPRFMSLQGYVLAYQNPINYDDMRKFFENAKKMKHDPDIKYLKRWYDVEKNSGHGMEYCLKVTEIVKNGRNYSDSDKLRFQASRAVVLFNRAREDGHLSPEKSLYNYGTALVTHLNCLYKYDTLGIDRPNQLERHCRNTAYLFFQFILRDLGQVDVWFEQLNIVIDQLQGREMQGMLDPIEDPLRECFEFLSKYSTSKAEMHKIIGRMGALKKTLLSPKIWESKAAMERVQRGLNRASDILATKIERAR